MAVEAFLEKVKELRIPLWIRHVVVPGLTDTQENVEAVYQKAKRYPNLEKIEWLPFHTMCLEKYQQMGIPFPLEGTPPMDAEKVKALTASYAVVEEKLPPVTEAFLHTFIWKMSINCTENFVNICWHSLTITHGIGMIGIIEILHEKDYFDNKTERYYTA